MALPPNDSSTGGYLVPINILDADTTSEFQKVIVGLSGLPGPMVRPRWQPNPPNSPPITDNWAAVGVHREKGDVYAYTEHDPTGDGSDLNLRHAEADVLCSFYGPDAKKNADKVRDGLGVEQNREVLKQQGLSITEVDEARAVPALISSQWYNRWDMTIRVYRVILRRYSVLNISSAEGNITSEGSVETLDSTINVNP